jgi:hypothetical protein
MSKSLSNWRMRCETENTYVYSWSEDQPSTCPNGADHVLDPTRTVGISRVDESATIVKNLPLTPFDRVMVSEETVLLSLKPGMGVSKLRDILELENGATVVNALNNPEYVFSVAGTGSKATMRTAERCRYMPGIGAEVGIGGHLPSMLVLGQSLKFGMFDESNGYYFEITHNNLYAVIRKDGNEIRTQRADFSIDRMDGNGRSGLFLNPMKGYIWTIRFSWYGYGAVEFSVISEDASQEQHAIVLHRYYTQTRPSISVPNLPITVTLDAGVEGSPGTAYITGRKYSVLGKFEPMTREGSLYRIIAMPNISNGWTPVMSIRRKQDYLSAPVVIQNVSVFAETGTSVFKVVTGATLTGPTVWGAPGCYNASETAVECDTTTTGATGGITVWKGFVCSNAVMSNVHNTDIDFYLTEKDPVTILVKDVANLGELSMSTRWQEEW